MTLNGYECKTTFWSDFSIADRFGVGAIKDTFRRAFREWRRNTEYLTELVMVLNHKIWQWYGRNDRYAEVYNDLWAEADGWAMENLTGEDMRYFLNVTD